MAVRKLRLYGDPVLRRRVSPVEDIDEDTLNLIEDMIDTMRANEGIGLAAPQVGVSRSVMVVDLSLFDEALEPAAFLNASFKQMEGTTTGEEGCLSIPGIRGDVDRSESVTVQFTDVHGKEQILTCTGLLARVFQHEYDHLQGILFIDRLPATKRSLLAARLKQIARGELVS